MFRRFFILCILFIVYNLITINESARILAVFPVPSISHQVVFRPLTQELAKRGHELVIVTTDPAFPKGQTPQNITEIDLHEISYKIWIDEFVNKVDGSIENKNDQTTIALRSLSHIFETQINSEEFKKIIESDNKFDLLIIEACVRIAIMLSHVIKAPVIQISSFGAAPPNYESMGVITHPLYTPNIIRQRLYNLNMIEKIEAIYEELKLKYIYWNLIEAENNIVKNYLGKNAPTISELNKNVDLLMLNINPIWEGNQAVPPGVIHLGGLHQNSPKVLPKDLLSYLETSKHGVIYMSFGTNVDPSLLPPERLQVFKTVFSKLPYNVLWKWKYDDMEGKPNNVRISKWFPQSDLLRHPKIKLFITQGGLQSTDEAITAGVPLLGFPMLGDQWYNCEKYPYHGIGLYYNLEDITEAELEKSIKRLIEDQSFRRNIEKLREMMHDRPQRPLERAVWWTEYVIRHRGAKHLRNAAANATWFEFLMLDVVITLLLVFTIFITTIYFAVKYIYKNYWRTRTAKLKVK